MSRSAMTRRRRGLITAAAAGVLVLAAIVPSLATLGGSTFESADGNLAAAGGLDWNQAITAANINSGAASKQTDLTSSSQDNAFGQGAKEDTPSPTRVSGSIPPNKSDLSRFYTYTDKGSNDHTFLYLAWERTNVLGTANMDFELNQSRTLGANGATPIRTAGDLLVTYDFANGGSRPTLGLLTWLTAGNGDSVSDCFSANALPCWGARLDLDASNAAEGAINTGSVQDTIAPNAPRTLAANTFGEAGIDLTVALPDVFGPNPTACESFGSAFLKSRSSTSFTAEMKDFIAPANIAVSNCGHVLVHKTAADTGLDQGGATFSISPGQTTSGGTATSSTIPAVSGHTGYYCVDNLLLGQNANGGYTVTETAAPSGYNVDGPWTNVQAVAGGCPSWTTTAPTVQVTASDPLALGAIKITKVGKDKSCTTVAGTCSAISERLLAGAGFELKQSGTVKYTSSLTNTNGVVCVSGVTPGTYTLHESTVPTGWAAAADSSVTIAGNTTCNGTGAAAPTLKKVTDQPLTTITVSTTPQVSGTTESTVQCTPADDTGDTAAVATPHTTNAVVPGTYVCTVVIDP
jgi:hypothetical protein